MCKRYIFVLLVLALFSSCSRETPPVELSDPGFGIVQTSIDAGDETVDLPVLIRTDKEIKGIQFTLTWDASIAKVGEPELTALNPDFTVSSRKGSIDKMKVLVYSLTGAVMNVSDPTILTIPMSIIDSQAKTVSLVFDKPVFAGPNAISYTIPVTHAKLRIQQ